jgi:S-adenosyl-L-methionine hydrolase (adenosine-forming)
MASTTATPSGSIRNEAITASVCAGADRIEPAADTAASLGALLLATSRRTWLDATLRAAVFITLTTDFGKQSQGVGMMEAVIAEIAPQARVIHYAHGIDDYDTASAARVLETVRFLMPAIHVCVCDPGVGTSRRALAVFTRRGDVLIGPDNGVLLPAAEVLGGVSEVREISNSSLVRRPVSPVFHGRDVFCRVAAHLANGLDFELVGELVDSTMLAPAPYVNAEHVDGRWLARVIHVDKFGNAHLNISQEEWDAFVPPDGGTVDVLIGGKRRVTVEHRLTFGDVKAGSAVILGDDDGRPALAVNRGSFAATYEVGVGDDVVVEYRRPDDA